MGTVGNEKELEIELLQELLYLRYKLRYSCINILY